MELSHDMLTHGVNVVCAQYDGQCGGLTVAWATQVAKNRVLICVGEQSATRSLILSSQAFGLSVLTAEQIDVARHFGTHSRAYGITLPRRGLRCSTSALALLTAGSRSSLNSVPKP
jgi:flavin reductase (DIM6/NTAB) family NADH-FMN oxidoreductase RutF